MQYWVLQDPAVWLCFISSFFTPQGASAVHHHRWGSAVWLTVLWETDRFVLILPLMVTAACQGDKRTLCLLAQGVLFLFQPNRFLSSHHCGLLATGWSCWQQATGAWYDLISAGFDLLLYLFLFFFLASSFMKPSWTLPNSTLKKWRALMCWKAHSDPTHARAHTPTHTTCSICIFSLCFFFNLFMDLSGLKLSSYSFLA